MNKAKLKQIKKELDIAMESGIEENMNWIEDHAYDLLEYIEELQAQLEKLKKEK